MKFEIEIPDGNRCDGCILLEAGCSSAYDHCRLTGTRISDSFIKPGDCPGRGKAKMKNSQVIRELLNDELDEFAKLKRDWDSYGGYPITNEALEKARHFIDGLFVCPTSEGGIAISLGDEEVIIEIHHDGSQETNVLIEGDVVQR